MLRVGVFPADEGGCGHYRMIWPWETAAKLFPDDIEVLWGKDLVGECVVGWAGGPWGEGEPTEYHTPITIESHPELDVAIFQRPLLAKSAPYFKLLRERGTFIVVDLDDNFDRVHRNNIAWYASEPHWMREEEMRKLSAYLGHEVTSDRRTLTDKSAYYHVPAHQGSHHRLNIQDALRETDLLIVSTPALKHHYGKFPKRTVVIDNYVPEWYFEHRRAEDDVNPSTVVGWTGSVATHPTDLQVMGASLSVLRRKGHVFTFKVVGTGKSVIDAIGIEPDTTSGGWVDLTDGSYQREYASLDIALCPLDDLAFNHAKSWLKGIEAASVGVVPVMSPLSEYQRLHNDGIGLLAKKPKDWEKHVRRLLDDPCMRQDMADRGQEVVRDHYTMEGNAWRWVEAIVEGINDPAR